MATNRFHPAAAPKLAVTAYLATCCFILKHPHILVQSLSVGRSKLSSPRTSSQRFLGMMASPGSAASPPRKIVVVGGGVQGTSVAYQISKSSSLPPGSTVTLLESVRPASAASGKGGGFMARSWGDGSPTEQLHHLAFDMYESLASELGCKTYRKLPVLSVAPGSKAGKPPPSLDPNLMPNWLDGNFGRISPMGFGDDTAQITPDEFVTAMISAAPSIRVLLGTCTGVDVTETESGNKRVVAVKYLQRTEDGSASAEEQNLAADTVIVSAGPWSCAAEDWFGGAVSLPMEGIKSTSIVWKRPAGFDVDATALFCGEDPRFHTHLEVYPRPDGQIYICGIGGSDYIPTEQLKAGAFREDCPANDARVDAATASFREMSTYYAQNGELQRVQACMRPCPPDAMPYMGSIPGYTGAYVNAGHNCWGIAWAPACGKAMAELVLDGSCSCVNLRPFDPARFTPKVSGGRGRKQGSTSVGEQW